jgi:hypothetical protein
MRQVCWRLFALLSLLFLGCGTFSLSSFSPFAYHSQSKVWHAFPSAAGEPEKLYAGLYSQSRSHGSMQAGLLKSFDFLGIRLPEQQVAAGLDTVRGDMVKLVLEHEGNLVGEPRLTISQGVLAGFEINYVQAGLLGTIRGSLAPGTEPGTFDLKCELYEKDANPHYRL